MKDYLQGIRGEPLSFKLRKEIKALVGDRVYRTTVYT